MADPAKEQPDELTQEIKADTVIQVGDGEQADIKQDRGQDTQDASKETTNKETPAVPPNETETKDQDKDTPLSTDGTAGEGNDGSATTVTKLVEPQVHKTPLEENEGRFKACMVTDDKTGEGNDGKTGEGNDGSATTVAKLDEPQVHKTPLEENEDRFKACMVTDDKTGEGNDGKTGEGNDGSATTVAKLDEPQVHKTPLEENEDRFKACMVTDGTTGGEGNGSATTVMKLVEPQVHKTPLEKNEDRFKACMVTDGTTGEGNGSATTVTKLVEPQVHKTPLEENEDRFKACMVTDGKTGEGNDGPATKITKLDEPQVHKTPNEDRFKACMVLAGVGDALGYKNGAYEFCPNGPAINNEVQAAGGVGNIKVNVKEWMVSDDTVMHIATAEALVSKWRNVGELYKILATKYKECMKDMAGRAPGNTCRDSTSKLRPKRENGYFIPFNPRGGGCGAAMRSVPIGVLYNDPDQLDELVAVSIESGRMTHNHPTGFLGSLATALFVSYAFQGKPLVEWGIGLMQTLDVAWQYIEKMERDVRENKGGWDYFKNSWERYLTDRGIGDGKSGPNFPTPYGPKERDRYYASISFSGWGGSSGHDAPMIAYDALLGCGDSWEELCSRAMFHGGDSDSTGIIAAACWGAMRGFEDVPECNYKNLEYRKRLVELGKQLHKKHTEL